MKRLFVISILSLLASSPGIAQDKIDCRHEGLLGPVKTVEAGRTEYPLVDGKAVEGRHLVRYQTNYNERCDRTEMTDYDADGKVLHRLVYTYDELGRNTGFLEFSRIVDKNLTKPRKHIYALDSNGRIVEYTVFDSDGSLSDRFTYKYDAKGNKLEEDFYSWMGTRGGHVVHTYDEAGHQLTATSYKSDDSVSWKTIDAYDADGKRIEWSNYQNNVLRYKIKYSYDKQGRVIEQETFEFNAPPNLISSHAPVPGKVTYAYDDSDRTRTVMTYLPSGTLKSSEIHTIDERGNETSLLTLDENRSIKNRDVLRFDKNNSVRALSGKPLWRFEYDSHDNWTKKTYLIWAAGAKEPEAWNAEYRIITYY